MNENPALSIIIPAYNSEAHFAACLDSLFFQDIKEPYEIIVCLEPSTDHTIEIAERYALTHPEMVLLKNEKRLGAALSRHRALELAKAPYVTFVDSDDLLSPSALRVAYTAISSKQADIVNFSFFLLKKNGSSIAYPFRAAHEKMISQEKALSMFLDDRIIRGFLWQKVFKKSLFDNADQLLNIYEANGLFEDVALNFSLILQAKKILLSPEAYYFYRKGENQAATSQPRTDRTLAHLKTLALMRLYLEKNGFLQYVPLFRRKLSRFVYSFNFDQHLDKKAGAPKAQQKKEKEYFHLLKSKNPLPIEGAFYSEDALKIWPLK